MNYRCTLYAFPFICIYVLLPFPLFSQQKESRNENPVSLEASYIGDNVNSLSGGIKTGSCYLGLANFQFEFDTKKAGIWKGGQLHLNAANTHGSSPSIDYIGDMQVASNIEAGNHTFFQELWYKQTLGNIDFTIGLQDLNIQFANTGNGALFLNSSFGILPTISGNFPAPVYPLTSLGFTCKWTTSEKIALLGAVYDGCPTDFQNNPYNLNWRLNSEDGLLFISEIQFSTSPNNLPGTFKLGFYSHNHWFGKLANPEETDSKVGNNIGIYVIADQMIWQLNQKAMGAFIQMGYGPSQSSQNYFYFGAGLNCYGLFKKSGNDEIGIAIASDRLKGNIRSECTIEFTYKTKLAGHLFIQPDIQYIIHPAGIGVILKNGLESILRFGIVF